MLEKDSDRRIFILDTNVLMHDPSSIYRFHEHDIFLPMIVLEELDRGKKGMSEVAHNVRQVSRTLDEMMGADHDFNIEDGLQIPGTVESGDFVTGRLFFETHLCEAELPQQLPGTSADNSILATAMALQKAFPNRDVTLVSKDINLRIKGAVLGLQVEDYNNDQVLDDVNLLYSGQAHLPDDFWNTRGADIESWQEEERTYYRMKGDDIADWYPNQCLYLEGDTGMNAIVRSNDGDTAEIELVHDYTNDRHSVWGITARNREQNFALNLLMDPEVDFVSLMGAAGTGKTLLALAAGLTQTLEQNRYREIIMTRVTVPVGEDIGFLPGTEEEKMTPWMGALMDNLEVLTQTEGGEWGRAVTDDLVRKRIRIRSLNYMRGRTFQNKYIILDEAQNLTAKQMKTLITRAGPGTKIICLGNIAQIDTPYLTETTSGITYAVDRFKQWSHSGHITLLRGERSRLADFASDNL